MEMTDILKKLRKERSFTQQNVADNLKISRAAYAQYETGKNIPTTESVLRLADLYNVSTDYLLGRYKTTP